MEILQENPNTIKYLKSIPFATTTTPALAEATTSCPDDCGALPQWSPIFRPHPSFQAVLHPSLPITSTLSPKPSKAATALAVKAGPALTYEPNLTLGPHLPARAPPASSLFLSTGLSLLRLRPLCSVSCGRTGSLVSLGHHCDLNPEQGLACGRHC